MKKLLLVLSLLLMTSCIAVDDFGMAWDQAGKDPSLMGKWSPVIREKDSEEADMFKVVDNGNSFRVHPYLNGKQMKEKKDQPALKTLQVGEYRFILGRDSKMGSMVRYKIENDVVSLYSLSTNAAWLYVTKKDPHNKGFERETAAGGKFDYLRIKTLDEPTLALLAGIPDNEYYWKLETKLRRAPDTVP